jgi:hypothetical protein
MLAGSGTGEGAYTCPLPGVPVVEFSAPVFGSTMGAFVCILIVRAALLVVVPLPQ